MLLLELGWVTQIIEVIFAKFSAGVRTRNRLHFESDPDPCQELFENYMV